MQKFFKVSMHVEPIPVAFKLAASFAEDFNELESFKLKVWL